ncbi:hypothetical protein [Halofilum ochraceum]|uniref:hypothetical protein n=1 Tax=Halofilum ochraceum TaxID=1611323 RepID=UPI0008D9BD17|nr:hypothetical protein [Halofilum ochraceum]
MVVRDPYRRSSTAYRTGERLELTAGLLNQKVDPEYLVAGAYQRAIDPPDTEIGIPSPELASPELLQAAAVPGIPAR